MQLFASVGTWNYILNRESHMQIYVLLYFHVFLFLSFLGNQTAGRISEIVLCISFLSSTKKIKFGFSFYFYYSSFFPLISRQPNDTKNHRTSWFNLDKIFSPKAFHFFLYFSQRRFISHPIFLSDPWYFSLFRQRPRRRYGTLYEELSSRRWRGIDTSLHLITVSRHVIFDKHPYE